VPVPTPTGVAAAAPAPGHVGQGLPPGAEGRSERAALDAVFAADSTLTEDEKGNLVEKKSTLRDKSGEKFAATVKKRRMDEEKKAAVESAAAAEASRRRQEHQRQWDERANADRGTFKPPDWRSQLEISPDPRGHYADQAS